MSARDAQRSDHQFQLLGARRFVPFFITQFLGAFNDNVFKNSLFILIAFQSIYAGASSSHYIINLASILFILPFLLFSAIAGQIADRLEKSALIRRIKMAEICIMLFAAVGFYLESVPLLLAALFLMGSQSSLFGPIKYSIIPQHLGKNELVGGNALVESGTFIAILLGTMLGGLLIGSASGPKVLVPCTIVALAALGLASSTRIPVAPAVDPELKVRWNPLTETFRNLNSLRENKTIFYAVLGISWFWFLGATYITQLPNFTHLSLHANEQVVTLFLGLFCIGIGTGSLLCERLSNRTIELGLVPVGSIGLTLFGADVFLATTTPAVAGPVGLQTFVLAPENWRLILDFFLIGMFGGIYIVPLYALIQARSNLKRRSRVIAGNNILNAILIIASALYAISLLKTGLTIPQLFLVTAALNACVAIYIYTLIPEFFIRFIAWILVHLVYRVKKIDLDNVPDKGGVVIASNHVSLMDALVIGGCIRRPIRFVMSHKIFNTPALRPIFRAANVIPIASKKEDAALFEQAFEQIAQELRAGNVVGIFPEGKLTSNGKTDTFKPGIDRILAETPVPVIPVALDGLWGSYFSNRRGKPMKGLPRKLWRKIKLTIGSPIDANAVSADILQRQVTALLADH